MSVTEVTPAAALILSYPQVAQERAEWCWAACAQSLLKYRRIRYAEQCEVAELARRFDPASFGTRNCCVDPGLDRDVSPDLVACNRGGAAEMVAALLNAHSFTATASAGTLSESAVRSELDSDKPFMIGTYRRRSNGVCDVSPHLVVAIGYEYRSGASGSELWIYVMDPKDGGGKRWVAYKSLTSSSGENCWFATVRASYAVGTSSTLSLFDNAGYGGISQSFSTGTLNLSSAMNDKTSSAVVRAEPYILYEGANRQGSSWPVFPGNYNSYRDWNGTNDVVSSVMSIPKMNLDSYIIAFEDSGFRGASSFFWFNTTNMVPIGWNDRISSMIVVGSGVVQVYQDSNFGGLPYAVTSMGGPQHDGFYASAADWGAPNDDISSIQLLGERAIILYDYYDMRGRAVALAPNVTPQAWFNDLRLVGMNDDVSAVVTRGWGGYWTLYADLNQTGVASGSLGSPVWYPDASFWGGPGQGVTSVQFTAP